MVGVLLRDLLGTAKHDAEPSPDSSLIICARGDDVALDPEHLRDEIAASRREHRVQGEDRAVVKGLMAGRMDLHVE